MLIPTSASRTHQVHFLTARPPRRAETLATPNTKVLSDSEPKSFRFLSRSSVPPRHCGPHFLQIFCCFRFRLKHQIDSFASFYSYLCHFADKMTFRVFIRNNSSIITFPSEPDLLDAAAATWTAHRQVPGEAGCVCTPERDERGLQTTIYF